MLALCRCRACALQGPADNRVGTLVVETEEDKWVFKVRNAGNSIMDVAVEKQDNLRPPTWIDICPLPEYVVLWACVTYSM